ncbi:MAG TPA: MFS transporter [Candidatus Binataceae bacterium]|nr:MFS transporter [Candidatus Binataceae bacterium]
MASFPAYGGPRSTELPPTAGRDSMWTPLRESLFRAIWLASLASNIGTWMQNVGASWLMTSLSPSPLMVSLIQTASSLPIFLLALPAGALADVVDRRRLLIISQAWMLVAAGALGLLTLAHTTTPMLLLILSFALGIGAALNAPAWQAIIPEVVTRNELPAAIALGGINFNFARAIGPALGGLIVALVGAGTNFILNALSFLGVIVVLYRWKRQHIAGVLPAERFVGAMRAGIRYVRHAPMLRAVLIRTGVFILGGAAMWATLPLIARQQLHLTAGGFGGLLGAFGAGAVIGGTALRRIRQHLSRDGLVIYATIVFAATTIGLGYVSTVLSAYLLMAAGGSAWVALMAELNVAAQLAVPRWVQGRALAIYQIVLQGGLAIMSVGWGALAEKIGIPWTMYAAGAALLLSTAANLRWKIKQADQLELDQVPIPIPEIKQHLHDDAGPVLIAIEYLIKPATAPEFEAVMQRIRVMRRRDGATFWALFCDAAQPERYIEYWIVDTWMEHLRQHLRVTQADHDLLKSARSFHIGEKPPVTSHQLAASGGVR